MRHTTSLLCLGVTCVSARADVTVFEDPDGVINWALGIAPEPLDGVFHFDITQDDSQDGSPTPTGLYRYADLSTSGSSTSSTIYGLAGRDSADVAGGTMVETTTGFGDSFTHSVLLALEPGDTVGPVLEFKDGWPYGIENCCEPPAVSWFFAGEYLGVRIEVDGRSHYGWIQFAGPGVLTSPMRWAYENEPDTAITIPCSAADLAEPFGTLDFSDATGFLLGFAKGASAADLAAPFGTFDFSDVIAFLDAFGAGCP